MRYIAIIVFLRHYIALSLTLMRMFNRFCVTANIKTCPDTIPSSLCKRVKLLFSSDEVVNRFSKQTGTQTSRMH